VEEIIEGMKSRFVAELTSLSSVELQTILKACEPESTVELAEHLPFYKAQIMPPGAIFIAGEATSTLLGAGVDFRDK
jgi:hypothetical protein